MAKTKPAARTEEPADPPEIQRVKPEMKVRIGRIKTYILMNHTDNGQYYSVVITRLYKEDDQ
jgi:hypothetical protein